MSAANHPGFVSVASHIAHKEHVPISRAKAILASSTRHASTAAKIANPDLLRVKGAGVKRRRGKGWEEELAKAIARDKESQGDKAMADKIRSAAMANAKKRGGSGKGKKRKHEEELDPVYEMIDVEKRHPHFTYHAPCYTGIHKGKKRLAQGQWYTKKKGKGFFGDLWNGLSSLLSGKSKYIGGLDVHTYKKDTPHAGWRSDII